MSANSRFAMAVHTLALLARNQRAISSSQIANSVNTNPVTIRKVLGSLNTAGLIETQMGAEGGAILTREPQTISLLQIYRATEQKALFAFHPKPPNQQCACGRNITGALECVFDEAEGAMLSVLHNKTLADFLNDMDEHACLVAEEIPVV